MHRFHDKVVLVTGGSSGIGRATAVRLAELGARVSLAARNREALNEAVLQIEQCGSEGFGVPTDVTEEEQCRHAVEQTIARFGQLDVLICSAGLSMRGYFEDSQLQAVERILRINFFGTLYATHYALPHVKKTKGSLVAVSSLTGKRGLPAYSAYGASKFAVQGLYESLRLELKRDGVHVGIVSPGYVETPILKKVLQPDGRPWDRPPPLSFRIIPIEKCVNCVIRLLVKRRREALLPWSIGPLMLLDKMFGSWIGDWTLLNKFPPERYKIKE